MAPSTGSVIARIANGTTYARQPLKRAPENKLVAPTAVMFMGCGSKRVSAPIAINETVNGRHLVTALSLFTTSFIVHLQREIACRHGRFFRGREIPPRLRTVCPKRSPGSRTRSRNGSAHTIRPGQSGRTRRRDQSLALDTPRSAGWDKTENLNLAALPKTCRLGCHPTGAGCRKSAARRNGEAVAATAAPPRLKD